MNREKLEQKRAEIHKSMLDYQTQVIACQGALKLIDDLLAELAEDEERKDND